jgi:hypothetical protein
VLPSPAAVRGLVNLRIRKSEKPSRTTTRGGFSHLRTHARGATRIVHHGDSRLPVAAVARRADRGYRAPACAGGSGGFGSAVLQHAVPRCYNTRSFSPLSAVHPITGIGACSRKPANRGFLWGRGNSGQRGGAALFSEVQGVTRVRLADGARLPPVEAGRAAPQDHGRLGRILRRLTLTILFLYRTVLTDVTGVKKFTTPLAISANTPIGALGCIGR